MVGDLSIIFMVPAYGETDANCPPVSGVTIFENDCTTTSTAFESSANIFMSLTNGFYKATLADKTTPLKYKFCLGVVTSLHTLTVPGLEFVLEANCKTALSKAATSSLQVE